MGSKRRPLAISLTVLGATVAVASVLTSPRAVPAPAPLLEGAQVPPQVMALLDRACRDCHSDATRYPWYGYVAPVSWLVKKDVEQGRARLNLSRWQQYSAIRRQRFLSEIANQVKDRDMPLGVYTAIHREARLSEADVEAIFQWTQQERMRMIEAAAGDRR